jgi:VanZ family protein
MTFLLERLVPRGSKIIWLIWAAMVITGSLLPGKDLPAAPVSDKIEHFTAYFGLTVLPPLFLKTRRSVSVCPFLMVLLGICLEIAQIWIPGRTCDVMDAVANTVGAAVGFVAGLAAAKLVGRAKAGPTSGLTPWDAAATER